jgi:hypothetical protein
VRQIRIVSLRQSLLFLTLSGLLPAQSDKTIHPQCSFFGPQRDRLVDAMHRPRRLSAVTAEAVKMAGYVPISRATSSTTAYKAGSIDAYIFADLEANHIRPAAKTTDWEFIRRVTLDLTGRIPTPERTVAFVADTTANKRAKLVDELIAQPAWLDKWTMFYGDLLHNAGGNNGTQVFRYAQGRDALYAWIQESLAKDTWLAMQPTFLDPPDCDWCKISTSLVTSPPACIDLSATPADLSVMYIQADHFLRRLTLRRATHFG